jgi:hypothetical protein
MLADANFMFKSHLIGRVWQYADRTNATSNSKPPFDDKLDHEIAAMKECDVPVDQGLTRAQASEALRRNGIDPRAFGSWVRHGWVIREGDKRYLSPKGRQWLKDQRASA